MEALGDVRELAGLLEETGDLDGAKELYERILGLQPGSKNLEEVAWMQYSLACLAIGWGGYSRAKELLTECIAALEQTGGSRLAVAYESLAHVEEQEGRVSFALEELAKATEVWEKCDPPQLENLARNLELRAELSEQLRLHVDANHLRKRARHIAAAAEDRATTVETPTI
jgi:tetratricopeptide (TPR) repeat protein